MKGRNSSSSLPLEKPFNSPLMPPDDFDPPAPGRLGPPSSASSAARSSATDGSNRGCKNARNRLRM
jgi:hypothetical protein